VSASQPTDLYFGPSAPSGHEGQWIKTIPGKGWFVYFPVYGPEQAAFDGSRKAGDFGGNSGNRRKVTFRVA
jgi:hypothetical protein